MARRMMRTFRFSEGLRLCGTKAYSGGANGTGLLVGKL